MPQHPVLDIRRHMSHVAAASDRARITLIYRRPFTPTGLGVNRNAVQIPIDSTAARITVAQRKIAASAYVPLFLMNDRAG